MADVVVGPQVIDGIVRLEMHGDHPVDVAVLKRGLVAVDIVRSPFVDGFRILVQGAGMENIVMIEEPDVLPRGQLETLVGVSGNPLVFGEFSIHDPPVLRSIFPADLPHVSVGIVRTVRQTELPSCRKSAIARNQSSRAGNPAAYSRAAPEC